MSEQLYAIARKVPKDTTYLIAGKPYAFSPASENGGHITSEDASDCYILQDGCAHLNGGNWAIKTASKLTAKQRATVEKGGAS